MSASTYLIDVVIPAYNAQAFITQTLQSVIAQDIAIQTVIVVNDGSTDQTAQLVQEFSQSHPQPNIVLINQDNAGLSAARNAGIKYSVADYIAPLDADDLWEPNKLSSQIQVFKDNTNPQLGLVYTAYQLIDQDGKRLPSNPKSVVAPTLRGNVYRPLLRGNFISGSGSGVLIKRAVFENVGLFDESLQACEDWDMWLRISRHYQFDFINQPLVSIRVHSQNMQKDRSRMISAEMMVLNKMIDAGDPHAFLLWKLRTYLINSHISATSLAGYERCSPRLQNLLSGWRMTVAAILIMPAQLLAKWYLERK